MNQLNYIHERLEDTIQDLMVELENYYHCESGDVDPFTAMEIYDTERHLAKLLTQVIRYNQK